MPVKTTPAFENCAKLDHNPYLPRGTVLDATPAEDALQAQVRASVDHASEFWRQGKAMAVDEIKQSLNVVPGIDDAMRHKIANGMYFSMASDKYNAATHPFFAEYSRQEVATHELERQVRAMINERIGPPEFDGMRQLADFPRSQAETPAFRKWFCGSKAVGKDGLPLIAFHGTNKDFTEFLTVQERAAGRLSGDNWLGQLGTWFAAPADSGAYEIGNAESTAEVFTELRNRSDDAISEGAVIYPVFLSIKNPYELEGYESILEDRDDAGGAAKLRARLIKQGYDGIVVRESDTDGGQFRDDWIAFHPEQIKSALGNNGEFDARSPDIRFSLVDQDDQPSLDVPCQ